MQSGRLVKEPCLKDHIDLFCLCHNVSLILPSLLLCSHTVMLLPPAERQVVQLTLPLFALLTHLRMPLIADVP